MAVGREEDGRVHRPGDWPRADRKEESGEGHYVSQLLITGTKCLKYPLKGRKGLFWASFRGFSSWWLGPVTLGLWWEYVARRPVHLRAARARRERTRLGPNIPSGAHPRDLTPFH